MSQDPEGFGAGDANLYRYVDNSPVADEDPSGLYRLDDQQEKKFFEEMERLMGLNRQQLLKNKDFAKMWKVLQDSDKRIDLLLVDLMKSKGGGSPAGEWSDLVKCMTIATKSPANQTPQGALDTLIHETVHAVLDLTANNPKLANPLPANVTDLKHDPKLLKYDYLRKKFADPLADESLYLTDPFVEQHPDLKAYLQANYALLGGRFADMPNISQKYINILVGGMLPVP